MTEEISTFESLDDIRQQNQRPAFLKVLCILSWIYVGFGVLGGLINTLGSQDDQIRDLNNAKELYNEMFPELAYDLDPFIYAQQENLKFENSIKFILLLIEGLAVFMMFVQKRIGFWIYSGVQLSFILLYISIYPFPNLFSYLTIFGISVPILIFSILYALNLKHMNR